MHCMTCMMYTPNDDDDDDYYYYYYYYYYTDRLIALPVITVIDVQSGVKQSGQNIDKLYVKFWRAIDRCVRSVVEYQLVQRIPVFSRIEKGPRWIESSTQRRIDPKPVEVDQS